jgi:hypothetical protein
MWRLLALLVFAGAASAVCTADALWPACEADTQCAWAYRSEGIAGLQRTVTFLNKASPSSASWLASVAVATDCASNDTTVQLNLAAALRYRLMMENAALSCEPGENLVYDPSNDQYVCICPAGRTCVSTNVVDTASGVYWMGLATTIVGAVAIVVMFVLVVVRIVNATHALLARERDIVEL